jgi:F-type H+-transporting ATPase subunit b
MISALLATTEAVAAHAPEATGEVGKFAAQFGIEPAYLAWQFGSFSLLAIVLYQFGIKPLLSTMDERQRKIEEGLKFSEEIKAKLADAEKSAEAALAKAGAEAASTLAAARATAEKRIADSAQDAIAKANEIIAKGNEAVALERAKMLAEVRAEVARLVVATSGKVLSRELSADEKSRYAESAAKELAAR